MAVRWQEIASKRSHELEPADREGVAFVLWECCTPVTSLWATTWSIGGRLLNLSVLVEVYHGDTPDGHGLLLSWITRPSQGSDAVSRPGCHTGSLPASGQTFEKSKLVRGLGARGDKLVGSSSLVCQAGIASKLEVGKGRIWSDRRCRQEDVLEATATQSTRCPSHFGSMGPVKRRIQNQNVAWPCNKTRSLCLSVASTSQGPQLVSREQGRQWFQTRASRMRVGTKPDVGPLCGG